MKLVIQTALLALAVSLAGQRTADAQVINPGGVCGTDFGITRSTVIARMQWALFCRDHPRNGPDGLPLSAEQYLTSASVDAYNSTPLPQRDDLFPVYFDVFTFSIFTPPNVPGLNCALLPHTAFNMGLCTPHGSVLLPPGQQEALDTANALILRRALADQVDRLTGALAD